MGAKLSFTFKHFKFPLFPLGTHSPMGTRKRMNIKGMLGKAPLPL